MVGEMREAGKSSGSVSVEEASGGEVCEEEGVCAAVVDVVDAVAVVEEGLWARGS